MAPAPPSPPARLAVRDLSVSFGTVRALDGVDLTVRPGEVVGVIGSNGAGKTTLLDVICGATAASGGSLEYDGAAWSPDPNALAGLGIARTKQDLDLPAGKAVVDVVLEGAAPPPRTGLGAALRSVFGGGYPADSTSTRRSSSRRSASPDPPTNRSTRCLPCCVPASPSRARPSRIRACSCSTSRPPAWTRTSVRSSPPACGRSRPSQVATARS